MHRNYESLAMSRLKEDAKELIIRALWPIALVIHSSVLAPESQLLHPGATTAVGDATTCSCPRFDLPLNQNRSFDVPSSSPAPGSRGGAWC